MTGNVEAGLGTVSEDSKKFGDFTGLDEKGAHLVLCLLYTSRCV